MDTADIVIIGAGAGAKLIWGSVPGRSVAVVERELMGGYCPFYACVPSKAMLRSARVWELGADEQFSGLFTGRADATAAYRQAVARRDVEPDKDERGRDLCRLRRALPVGVGAELGDLFGFLVRRVERRPDRPRRDAVDANPALDEVLRQRLGERVDRALRRRVVEELGTAAVGRDRRRVDDRRFVVSGSSRARRVA